MSQNQVQNQVQTEAAKAQTGAAPGTAEEAARIEAASAQLADGVSKIRDLIVAKFTDEGTRNLSIGAEVLADLLTLKHHFESSNGGRGTFTSGDFDKRGLEYRTAVRLSDSLTVSLSPIRVDDWVRSSVLRSLVAAEIGEDRAARISYWEYRSLSSSTRALSFSKSDLVGILNPGWLDFIKSIVTSRETGKRVAAETFEKSLEAWETARKKAADERDRADDPEGFDKKLAAEERRIERRENQSLSTSLT